MANKGSARIFTVWELTRYVKRLLQGDETLQSLWVKGEVADFRRPTSGHMYFTLKDREASLRCVMFRGKNRHLTFVPGDGQGVVIRGSLSLYEKSGNYQLYVEEMLPAGAGDLNQALERLKEALREEGLFDPRHKKPIPFLPRRVAVVTSPTGAVVRDIITTVRRRSPGTPLLVVPVPVQGAGSAAEIAAALNLVNRRKDCDLIILARGGGSLEELWSFNDEEVARSIFQSDIPVISAIGHETDFTIADLVADMRAATPTAAAEIAVPSREDLIQGIGQLEGRLRTTLRRQVLQERRYLEKLASSRALTVPEELTRRHHQALDHLGEKAFQGMEKRVAAARERLSLTGARLEGISPLKTLRRGYTLVEDARGRPVTRARSLIRDSLIHVRFQDGSARCQVKDVKGEEDNE